jgi:hypothetical protein
MQSELLKQQKSLLNHFLREIKSNKNIKNIKKINKLQPALANQLYQMIYQADQQQIENEKINEKNFEKKKQPTIINTKMHRPTQFNSSIYFPAHILRYITAEEKYQLIFTMPNITIYFTLFNESDLLEMDTYIKYVNLMRVWLHICTQYKKSCAKTISIYVYFSPFLKLLPEERSADGDEILSPTHVNTAFTQRCVPHGEIVIYRQEEWFKVFIHETFHAFGLDFGSPKLDQALKALFPIESKYDAAEAYTETWARIINCVFYCYQHLPAKTDQPTSFGLYLEFCLELERLFALYQCNKVLRYMNLTYTDLLQPAPASASAPANKYKENTHVFAYYVLTSLFLNNYTGFLNLCLLNNPGLLQFNSTTATFQNFYEYIKSQYNTPLFHAGLAQMETLYKKCRALPKKNTAFMLVTTRMSILG